MEDMQKICDLLTEALRETKAGSRIDHIEYDGRKELAYIVYRNGCHTVAAVDGDSGIALIYDIVNRLR